MASKIIQIAADGPARIAQRIVARLKRDGLVVGPDGPGRRQGVRAYEDALTEAIADEIHQDALDATLRGGS